MRFRGRAVVLLLLLTLAAPALPAQAHVPPLAVSCLDTISASALTRVDAFLEADSVPLFGADVAHQVTAYASVEVMHLLGGSVDSLPSAEPTLGWRDLRVAGGRVLVTVHRDGTFGWRRPAPDSSRVAALLDRALRRVLAGGTLFPLSDGPRDSVAFYLGLDVPTHRRNGRVDSMRVQHAVAVFTIATPWTALVKQIGDAHPIYPSVPMENGYGATVVLQFVVDSTGRAEMRTVHDVWPAWRARLAGMRGAYYETFVTAARRSLASARFHPRLVGGCPVRQLVVMPFVFTQRPP